MIPMTWTNRQNLTGILQVLTLGPDILLESSQRSAMLSKQASRKQSGLLTCGEDLQSRQTDPNSASTPPLTTEFPRYPEPQHPKAQFPCLYRAQGTAYANRWLCRRNRGPEAEDARVVGQGHLILSFTQPKLSDWQATYFWLPRAHSLGSGTQKSG
jgi:hypothetical protein